MSKEKFKKFGAVWPNMDENGEKYYTGKLEDGRRVKIVPNPTYNGGENNRPVYILYAQEKVKDNNTSIINNIDNYGTINIGCWDYDLEL